jgi:hypothetical protein
MLAARRGTTQARDRGWWTADQTRFTTPVVLPGTRAGRSFITAGAHLRRRPGRQAGQPDLEAAP